MAAMPKTSQQILLPDSLHICARPIITWFKTKQHFHTAQENTKYALIFWLMLYLWWLFVYETVMRESMKDWK